jgi:hypothetical protein
MTDTATPATGPVDAPASIDSIATQIAADLEAGGEAAPALDDVDSVTQELVNEAESDGGEPSEEEPTAEEDATDPAEEAPEAEVEATQDEPVFTVKVNGEEIQVSQSELLNGYSRTEDYKQKTAAVAEQRRDLEAKATTIEADVKAHYATQLEEATNLFAQYDPVLAEARTINWAELKRVDPHAYVQAQDAVQARLTAIQDMQERAQKARGESEQQQAQQEQQERAARFDATADEIVKVRPDLADEAKFKDFAATNIGFLKEIGFQPDEIASSLDHRVLTLADDARQWRAHKAAQASLPQKKIVQKSAVKPLTTDGAGSRATPNRFPGNASRDRKADWVVNQLLSEE